MKLLTMFIAQGGKIEIPVPDDFILLEFCLDARRQGFSTHRTPNCDIAVRDENVTSYMVTVLPTHEAPETAQ